jgi:hypothetical protein
MAVNKEADINKFLTNIEDSWKETRIGNSKKANAKTRAIKSWLLNGKN